MRIFLLTGLLLAAALTVAAQDQDQSAGNAASLSGTVTGSAGLPLRKASVTLQPLGGFRPGQPVQPLSSTTDNAGHFTFSSVPPGRYNLFAERTGYLRGAYSAKPGAATPVLLSVTPGLNLNDLSIRLIEQAAITGKVVDPDGDPLPRVQVRLLRPAWVNGRRQLSGQGLAQTDDIGQFRLAAIPAGQYYLVAEPGPGNAVGIQPLAQPRDLQARQPEAKPVPTFYPGVTDPESAVRLTVHPGDTLTAIEIRMAQAPAVRVRGTVTGQFTSGRSRVMMTPAGSVVTPGITLGSAIAKDGSFEIAGVTPGLWNLGVMRNEGPPQYVSNRIVQVSAADLEGLTLSGDSAPPIHGQVRLEDSETAPRLRLSLTPLDGPALGSPSAATDESGHFTLTGAGPGHYALNLTGLPSGTYAKSLRLNGREIPNSGFEIGAGAGEAELDITLSPHPALLNAAVLSEDGKPAPGAVVTLIPDPARPDLPYLYLRLLSDQNALVNLPGVAPGKYQAIAWTELEPGAQFDPDLVHAAAGRAVPITLAEGEQQVITLITALPPQ